MGQKKGTGKYSRSDSVGLIHFFPPPLALFSTAFECTCNFCSSQELLLAAMNSCAISQRVNKSKRAFSIECGEAFMNNRLHGTSTCDDRVTKHCNIPANARIRTQSSTSMKNDVKGRSRFALWEIKRH